MALSGFADIDNAVSVLERGGLVAFPTETVYGLGADATSDAAVGRIFAAKGRPSNNPLIIHVASIPEIFRYTDSDACTDAHRRSVERLSKFWPGPLSVVLPRGKTLSRIACAGGETAAFRIPSHPLANRLLERFGKPIAAPSANRSNLVSPTTAEHVRDGLGDAVDVILDGGPCVVGIESTVVSLVHARPTILRPGSVTRQQLEEALGEPVNRLASLTSSPMTAMPSPGMLEKHYAPKTRTTLRQSLAKLDALPNRVGALVFDSEPVPFPAQAVVRLSSSGNLAEVAAGLFAGLRQLDSLGLDLIVVDSCEPIGLGEAIMDRLLRAAAAV